LQRLTRQTATILSHVAAGCALMLPLAALTGCGMGPAATSSVTALTVKGRVHGGNQPVSGSTIQLYAMGTATASAGGLPVTPAAVPLIAGGLYYPGGQSGCTPSANVTCNSSVLSDANGDFTISGDYTCTNASLGTTTSSQVYIVSMGGNPGLASGTNNTSLVMLAALGTCGNLSSSTDVFINEVTTVAAAWALAPFMTAYNVGGSSATNTAGLANAFLDAQLLADTSSGLAATLPSNLTIETGKLYALADAIAACVNSDGTSACDPLFAAAKPSGGTKPTDTFGATLSIVKNPGQNVAAVWDLASSFAPFATTLTQSPNDWTMSLTVTGGGLVMPTALGIDQVGNVWVTGQAGPLAEFNPQGTPLSGTGYGLGTYEIEQATGLAVDSLGDIWISNYNSSYHGPGSVTKFLGSTSGSPGTVVLDPYEYNDPTFFDSAISYPEAISADTSGNIFIANNGTSSATEYNSSGQDVGASLGTNAVSGEPIAVAADGSGGFWLSLSDSQVAHIGSSGSLVTPVADCCYESYGLATDANKNVWVASYLANAMSEISGTTGNVLIGADPSTGATPDTGAGGLYRPALVAIDAAQNVWVTNLYAASITELAGSNSLMGAGTPISPTTGVYTTGGYGLDAGLKSPYGIVPDTSGNVWVSNQGKAAVTMFFGLATPTVTPTQPAPTAP
jgi:streptogramin lyase